MISSLMETSMFKMFFYAVLKAMRPTLQRIPSTQTSRPVGLSLHELRGKMAEEKYSFRQVPSFFFDTLLLST